MTHITSFDHVGITVADLEAATAFFVGLGLEVEESMVVEGEFLDAVTGLEGGSTEIVMLKVPDGGTRVELSSFERPFSSRAHPRRWPTRSGCAAWPSSSTTSARCWIGSPRTATDWSAA